MKIRLNRFNRFNRYSTKKTPKSVRKQRKQNQNYLKDLILSSITANDTNKELVEKNVSLMAEIEILKREKLQIFESHFFKRNQNSSAIKNDLIVLLESLKTDHKSMIEMFQKCNEFYCKMIDKINDKIEDLIGTEDQNNTAVNSSEERPNSQTLYNMRRELRQNYIQNNLNEENVENLTVIEEESHEISKTITNETETQFCSANSELLAKTPTGAGRDSSAVSASYQITPHFSTQYMRTPSIYLNTIRRDLSMWSDRTSLSPYDMTLKELSITNFHSFDTTINENQNPMTASTPVHQIPALDMMRASKRFSSIAIPYSPRQSPKGRQSTIGRKSMIGRPSLFDIQNIMETKKGKKKSKNTKGLKTKATESQTNVTNSPKQGKKKRKICDTISIDSDISEANLNNTSYMTRSLRARKPVSYKEPSLNSKIRRTIDQ